MTYDLITPDNAGHRPREGYSTFGAGVSLEIHGHFHLVAYKLLPVDGRPKRWSVWINSFNEAMTESRPVTSVNEFGDLRSAGIWACGYMAGMKGGNP